MGNDNTWDRQRDAGGQQEPALWFGRFDKFYRPQGTERSLLGAYNAWRRLAGKSGNASRVPSSWDNNSRKWNWKERAEGWDAHERRKRIAAEQDARAEMLKHHINLGRTLQMAGARRLQDFVKDSDALSTTEARHYVKTGIEVERQARGMPEHLLAVTQMTDEELLTKYSELLAGFAGSGRTGSGDQ